MFHLLTAIPGSSFRFLEALTFAIVINLALRGRIKNINVNTGVRPVDQIL